jgi:hypothetical protein
MKRTYFPGLASIALAAALAVTWAPTASAQYSKGNASSAAQQAPSPDKASVTDDELKSFAAATIEVQQVNKAYSEKLRSASSPDQQTAIRKEANDKMIQAVEHKGLTVKKYNMIFAMAESDPEIANKVRDYIRKAQ